MTQNESTASGIGHPTSRPSLLGRAISRVFDIQATWRERAHSRAILASFDDRLLEDIGCTRADVRRECHKPFWIG